MELINRLVSPQTNARPGDTGQVTTSSSINQRFTTMKRCSALLACAALALIVSTSADATAMQPLSETSLDDDNRLGRVRTLRLAKPAGNLQIPARLLRAGLVWQSLPSRVLDWAMGQLPEHALSRPASERRLETLT